MSPLSEPIKSRRFSGKYAWLEMTPLKLSGFNLAREKVTFINLNKAKSLINLKTWLFLKITWLCLSIFEWIPILFELVAVINWFSVTVKYGTGSLYSEKK